MNPSHSLCLSPSAEEVNKQLRGLETCSIASLFGRRLLMEVDGVGGPIVGDKNCSLEGNWIDIYSSFRSVWVVWV